MAGEMNGSEYLDPMVAKEAEQFNADQNPQPERSENPAFEFVAAVEDLRKIFGGKSAYEDLQTAYDNCLKSGNVDRFMEFTHENRENNITSQIAKQEGYVANATNDNERAMYQTRLDELNQLLPAYDRVVTAMEAKMRHQISEADSFVSGLRRDAGIS